MTEGKRSFVLYKFWLKPVSQLADADVGKLFKAILEFVNGIEPVVEESFEGLYCAITEQIVFEWSKFNPKTGKYHWNYQGGISAENHVIRNSTAMKNWRENVFSRDNFTCMHCGQRGGILNAHHIKPFSSFPELRFEIRNGITLCQDCHIKEHKRLRNER